MGTVCLLTLTASPPPSTPWIGLPGKHTTQFFTLSISSSTTTIPYSTICFLLAYFLTTTIFLLFALLPSLSLLSKVRENSAGSRVESGGGDKCQARVTPSSSQVRNVAQEDGIDCMRFFPFLFLFVFPLLLILFWILFLHIYLVLKDGGILE